MGQGSNRVSVLKMPLDLSKAVDKEVYDVISGFKSGVEAKNFLCSAVLYYARSPLVLSSNALCAKLDKLESILSGLDFSYTGLQLEKILSKLDVVGCGSSVVSQDVKSASEVADLDPGVTNVLVSLRDKFKI